MRAESTTDFLFTIDSRYSRIDFPILAVDTSESGLIAMLVGVGALAAISIGVGVYVWFDRGSRVDPNSAEGLFVELCETYRLSMSDRQVLWAIAQRSKMAHPAMVFLSPEPLENTIRSYPEHASACNRLLSRLFEEA